MASSFVLSNIHRHYNNKSNISPKNTNRKKDEPNCNLYRSLLISLPKPHTRRPSKLLKFGWLCSFLSFSGFSSIFFEHFLFLDFCWARAHSFFPQFGGYFSSNAFISQVAGVSSFFVVGLFFLLPLTILSKIWFVSLVLISSRRSFGARVCLFFVTQSFAPSSVADVNKNGEVTTGAEMRRKTWTYLWKMVMFVAMMFSLIWFLYIQPSRLRHTDYQQLFQRTPLWSHSWSFYWMYKLHRNHSSPQLNFCVTNGKYKYTNGAAKPNNAVNAVKPMQLSKHKSNRCTSKHRMDIFASARRCFWCARQNGSKHMDDLFRLSQSLLIRNDRQHECAGIQHTNT